jgi:hypothetical protein
MNRQRIDQRQVEPRGHRLSVGGDAWSRIHVGEGTLPGLAFAEFC